MNPELQKCREHYESLLSYRKRYQTAVCLLTANLRHDQEHGDPFELTRVRCAWNEAHLMRRCKLTDRKIAQYERKGFYSAEFRDARKALQDRKAKKRARQGNFLVADDGRLIYDLK